MEAFYDNSEDNPDNPNYPPKPVSFGGQATDEMMFFYFHYTVDEEQLSEGHPLEEDGSRSGSKRPQGLKPCGFALAGPRTLTEQNGWLTGSPALDFQCREVIGYPRAVADHTGEDGLGFSVGLIDVAAGGAGRVPSGRWCSGDRRGTPGYRPAPPCR